jgi:Ni/Co efflux regulator RcnB
MNRLLITAVCAAMALPTVTAADDHGHAARPPAYQYQQGGGQHRDHNDGGQGHDNGDHGDHDNDRGGHQYNNGGRYPYYGYDQHHYNNGAYRYYNYGGYRPYYYGNSYPYYYGHSHHDGNDDALWAIGGLMVGAIIGSAVERASTHPPATTSAPLPPASQPQKYCDRIEYDSAGNPYVERSCK